MNTARLPLLLSSALVVPLALVVVAGPATAQPPTSSFGAHVSSCAQHTGFSGAHNPSHHRSSRAMDPMSGMHC